jgi:outer membrane protein assembly factor BamB
MRMKQAKILFLAVIVLLTPVLVSCVPGGTQAAKGWAGTTFHDGIIYAGTVDGRVVAINASSREELWSRPVVTQVSGGLACGPSTVADAIYTTPVVHGDLVYVGTYSGRVYALTIAQGAERWIYPRTGSIGAIVASPVIADETIYVSSSDGSVYALTVLHGDFKWRSERLADKLWTSPTVVGDRLYLSTLDGHIYTLSAETGQLLEWSFESEAGFASCPVVYEDTIYVGSFDNKLYAINIGDSEPAWTFRGGKWFWATPLVHEGVVYAGCLDGRFYVLDAETGEKMGEFDAGSPVVSSPVMMDDLLIVADESGTIYVFDLNAGPEDRATPLKTIAIDAGVRSSFCAEEGLVYIRGEDKKDNKDKLYIVDIDEGWIKDVPLTVEE